MLTMFVFIADMIIGFLTSYVNVSSGDEIFAFKMVANNYMRQTFLIDLLSTFPLDEWLEFMIKNTVWEDYLKLLGFLKL